MFNRELEENLKHAENAIEYVKSKLIYGSNSEKGSKIPTWEPKRIFKLRANVLRSATEYAMSHDGKADFSVISEITKDALEKYGFGNCGEQAQTAFVFLKDSGIGPLDFCVTTLGGHNLVVLGRAKDSDPNDISTWGDSTVVCDPWAEKVYPLSQFREMQKPEHNVRYAEIVYADGNSPAPYLSGNLESQYRLDTIPILTKTTLNSLITVKNQTKFTLFGKSQASKEMSPIESTPLISTEPAKRNSCCTGCSIL